jgi:hypothetical protein
VKARHRRGNGKWFAVIESHTTFADGDERVDCIAYKECNSMLEVEEAARALLAENAKEFRISTSIEAKLYCDLEWSPEDPDVYVWPVARRDSDDTDTEV